MNKGRQVFSYDQANELIPKLYKRIEELEVGHAFIVDKKSMGIVGAIKKHFPWIDDEWRRKNREAEMYRDRIAVLEFELEKLRSLRR